MYKRHTTFQISRRWLQHRCCEIHQYHRIIAFDIISRNLDIFALSSIDTTSVVLLLHGLFVICLGLVYFHFIMVFSLFLIPYYRMFVRSLGLVSLQDMLELSLHLLTSCYRCLCYLLKRCCSLSMPSTDI